MSNKYYTPDISDLFVGYDCQLHHISYILTSDSDVETKYYTKREEWMDVSISDETIHLYVEELKKGLIRTPYLTKEQIEEEGFSQVRENYYMKVVGYYDEEESNTGYEYYLSYSPNNNYLYISKDEINYGMAGVAYEPSDTLFSGYCKDINTLRSILKYINI